MISYLILILALSQDFIPFWNNTTGNHLSPNTIAYYRFEEASGNAADSSGNGRTLTENGTINPDTGIVGNARSYSSTAHTDYFSLASNPAFAFSGGACTMTFWANFNARSLDPNDMTLANRGDFTGANFSWWLFLDHGSPNDAMLFYWSTDGIYNPANVLTFPIVGEIGTGYNFIALRWNGTTLHLSVTYNTDSALASDVTTPFAGAFFEDGTANLLIGAAQGSSAHDMGGVIDEVDFLSRYVSDCELAHLFSAKAGTFTWPSFDSLPCMP